MAFPRLSVWLLALLVLLSGCITPTDKATSDAADPTDTPEARPSPSPSDPAAPPDGGGDPEPSASPEPDPEPEPEPEGETHTVTIGKTVKGPAAGYAPDPVRIKVGDSVVWDNRDSAVHTATADDGSFDTGSIGGGKKAEAILFETPGTFTYYCKAHPSTMKGAKVIVEA